MGLDSVELLMEFENYFGIKVPNIEAEKILTIQDMVTSVATHLNIINKDSELKSNIFNKLNEALIESGLITSSIAEHENIFKILNSDNEKIWSQVSDKLTLQLPKPYKKANGPIKRFFSVILIPNYNWETITTIQFVTAICANNYEKLIDRQKLKDHFEILAAIVAITVDKIGVDFYEVQPDKTFAYDLGID